MSGNDIQSIKEDMGEIKNSLSALSEIVIDLRLLVAEGYVKKGELDEVKKELQGQIKEIKNERNLLLGGIFAVLTSFAGIIAWVYNIAKGSGN